MFKKGNPGRPKGALNKNTPEIKTFARQLLESDEYRESLKTRVLAGKAPHMEPLLHHYGYGQPKQQIDADVTHHLPKSVIHELKPNE